MNKPVVTRFAPSPTGYLHIGGARTALFNWLYARAKGGKFLLRIEDTDRERSTPEATQAIFDGLAWLGLNPDEPATMQFERSPRHTEVALAMLDSGHAYKCFSTREEIDAFRVANPNATFLSPWRDRSDQPDAPFVVRLKAPKTGETVIMDEVQGKVTLQNENLDDMILLRSDGTPTYMHAVVVDDHDMGVTHIIRGDDHLINAARQSLIYVANGWDIPTFAHIPLIHGSDGKKLSKRHGALGVEAYRDMGYPAEAVRNYLTRLGWGHGDAELFTTDEAIAMFDLSGINKAPARLDLTKLDAVSAHHIKTMSEADLLDSINAYAAAQNGIQLDTEFSQKMSFALASIREKAKKIPDLLENAQFIFANRPLSYTEKALKSLDEAARGNLKILTSHLRSAKWSHNDLEEIVKAFCAEREIGLGKIAMPIRSALSGGTPSPSIFEMMVALGQAETIGRIEDAITA